MRVKKWILVLCARTKKNNIFIIFVFGRKRIEHIGQPAQHEIRMLISFERSDVYLYIVYT